MNGRTKDDGRLVSEHTPFYSVLIHYHHVCKGLIPGETFFVYNGIIAMHLYHAGYQSIQQKIII